MTDLKAIRARDAECSTVAIDTDMGMQQAFHALLDRRALLAYVDELHEQIRGMMKVGLETEAELIALREAARKVTQHHFDTCDEEKCTGPCSCGVGDLRRLLSEVQS